MNAKNATRNAAMQKDDSFAAEIRRAFPACQPGLSDEECEELAGNLALLRTEDLLRWLPALMLRMSETPPESWPWDADMVAIFLDGANLRREKDGSFVARSENSPFFDPRAKDVFAGFTSAQDAAVLRFLRDVLLPAWPECVPVVSAIVFWEYRTTHPATKEQRQ